MYTNSKYLVDSEAITVNYPNLQSVLKDLRMMGESNALSLRSGAITIETLEKLKNIYKKDFEIAEGYLPLTFCIIYFMAWT